MDCNRSALRRIQKEYKDMIQNKSAFVFAQPTEDDQFLWHFTIRGPLDSDYEGGLYHGIIELPSQYPFKPPKIMLLTPSGRFEIKKDLCMSFTDYHPESWQPAWTISNILHGLVSYMPIDENEFLAVGAIKSTSADRKKIAKISENFRCKECAHTNSQLLKQYKSDDLKQNTEIQEKLKLILLENLSEKLEKGIKLAEIAYLFMVQPNIQTQNEILQNEKFQIFQNLAQTQKTSQINQSNNQTNQIDNNSQFKNMKEEEEYQNLVGDLRSQIIKKFEFMQTESEPKQDQLVNEVNSELIEGISNLKNQLIRQEETQKQIQNKIDEDSNNTINPDVKQLILQKQQFLIEELKNKMKMVINQSQDVLEKRENLKTYLVKKQMQTLLKDNKVVEEDQKQKEKEQTIKELQQFQKDELSKIIQIKDDIKNAYKELHNFKDIQKQIFKNQIPIIKQQDEKQDKISETEIPSLNLQQKLVSKIQQQQIKDFQKFGKKDVKEETKFDKEFKQKILREEKKKKQEAKDEQKAKNMSEQILEKQKLQYKQRMIIELDEDLDKKLNVINLLLIFTLVVLACLAFYNEKLFKFYPFFIDSKNQNHSWKSIIFKVFEFIYNILFG